MPMLLIDIQSVSDFSPNSCLYQCLHTSACTSPTALKYRPTPVLQKREHVSRTGRVSADQAVWRETNIPQREATTQRFTQEDIHLDLPHLEKRAYALEPQLWLRDTGDQQCEIATHDDNFAACDDPVADNQIHRLRDIAIKLEDIAEPQRQDIPQFQLSGPKLKRRVQFDLEQQVSCRNLCSFSGDRLSSI
jgi:hypothetical protein